MRRSLLPLLAACALVAALLVSAAPALAVSGGTSAPADAAGAPVPGAVTGGSAPSPRPSGTPQRPVSAPTRRGAAGARDIPRTYLRLYRAAGAARGVDWRVLAAIGKNESDHGRSTARGVSTGVNFARCCSGPMQICTVASCGRVWQYYAIDADGDGIASVYEPADAIYAAAALVRDLQRTFGSRPSLLLAAYNAGPGAVRRAHGVPNFPETQAYVRNGVRYIAGLR